MSKTSHTSPRGDTPSWSRRAAGEDPGGAAARWPGTVFAFTGPCGLVRLVGNGRKLCRVELLGRQRRRRGLGTAAAPRWLEPYVAMLRRYFEGRAIRCEPSMLPLEQESPFRRAVYEALLRVPPGRVVSYGALARLCGREGAARAVGRAVAANPWPILVPCHRVVRADGRLGGFSAGLAWKSWLLRHEGRTVRQGRVAGAARVLHADAL